MTQLLLASTFYQCVSLAAAADAGALPPVDGERILVLANSSQAPELSLPLQAQQGFALVAARFDRVVDLAALVYPRRPTQFSPRRVELGMWEQLFRAAWELGSGPVQILMDSVQVNPAIALAEIFPDAALYAHSDGLMTYSPTRAALSLPVAQRMQGLIHLDLVPGLVPQLLRELDVLRHPVPRSALRAVLAEIAGPAPIAEHQPPTALLLGQYLPSLGLLSRAEEAALHRSMLAAAVTAGIGRCVFKPHPSAPPTSVLDLERAAEELGVTLEVDESPSAAEILVARQRPKLVLSCFSTALATAAFVLGAESRAVGTAQLMRDLAPYENSNRVPLVIADALFGGPAVGDLPALVEAVAYCMQPVLLAPLRDSAVGTLNSLLDSDPELVPRYFKRKRLTVLDLPGAWPKPVPRVTGPSLSPPLSPSPSPSPSTSMRVRRRLGRTPLGRRLRSTS